MKSDIIVIDHNGKRKVVYTLYRDVEKRIVDRKFLCLKWSETTFEYCESIKQFQNRCAVIATKLQDTYNIVYINLTIKIFDREESRTIWKNGGWIA